MESTNKLLLGIGAITILIIFAGAFFFGGNSNTSEDTQKEIENLDKNELTEGATKTVGSPDAPVTIVEFADLQCPACKTAHPIVKQLLEKYPDEVYYVYRHYPLSIHRNAKIAAQAAEAAADQGKFFEMEDKMFVNQSDWQDSGKADEIFEQYAIDIGLDIELFKSSIDEKSGIVNSDFVLGNKFQVQSTPTFFINGEKFPGVVKLSQLEAIIAAATQPNDLTTDEDHSGDPDTSVPPDQLPDQEQ